MAARGPPAPPPPQGKAAVVQMEQGAAQRIGHDGADDDDRRAVGKLQGIPEQQILDGPAAEDNDTAPGPRG